MRTNTEALLKDVQFQPLRASGPGGQHRNKVETAIRATHLPTGITVIATEHRSQYRNKKLALARLQTRLNIRNNPRKPRIKTRPRRSAIEKRLNKKSRHAEKKRRRQEAKGARGEP